MKGQVVLVWLFAIIALFILITTFYIFFPFISNDIAGSIENLSVNITGANKDGIDNVIGTMRIAIPVAFMVLVVGVILYIVASTQKEEPQAEII